MMIEVTDKKPKVSVCVVTYNQEKFIRQCLQSLVNQQVDFDFEVIVADDCSTDQTRSIVQEFADRYPDIVKPIFHANNIGAYKNFFFVHEHAKGQYIAHMDGDDYALPGKLQVQANFLDNHPNCNIVWHRMFVMNNSTGEIVEDLIDYTKLPKNGFGRSDILRFITIGMNSSKMYRSSVGRFDVPKFPIVDYFVNVEHIGSGAAFFVGNKPYGVYRAGIGIASSSNTTKVLLKEAFLYFSKKYPEHKRDIGTAAFVLFLAATKNRKWLNALMFGTVLIRIFNLGSIVDVWRNWDMISMFRIPNSIRRRAINK